VLFGISDTKYLYKLVSNVIYKKFLCVETMTTLLCVETKKLDESSLCLGQLTSQLSSVQYYSLK